MIKIKFDDAVKIALIIAVDIGLAVMAWIEFHVTIGSSDYLLAQSLAYMTTYAAIAIFWMVSAFLLSRKKWHGLGDVSATLTIATAVILITVCSLSLMFPQMIKDLQFLSISLIGLAAIQTIWYLRSSGALRLHRYLIMTTNLVVYGMLLGNIYIFPIEYIFSVLGPFTMAVTVFLNAWSSYQDYHWRAQRHYIKSQ